MLPLVALVGRPNVGKSTIFNALTRTRDALVHDQPGVTRDRNYGVCRLDEDNHFLVVDTGGIAEEEEGLAGATTRQARAAAGEADLILFVVDAREGTSAMDDEILAWLRKLSRPTLLLINKIDGTDEDTVRSEFARYGFSEMLTVSAAHRQGLDDLLDEVIQRLPERGQRRGTGQRPEPRAHCLRRPPERGQVDPGQPHPRRRADDRLGRAGYHPRFDLGGPGA